MSVKAASGATECPEEELEWTEELTPAIAYIYPTEDTGLGKSIPWLFDKTLQEDYAHFVPLFGVPLSLPIAVRIYTNETYYYCLNTLATELAPSVSVTHIGSREIALIGAKINPQQAGWQEEIINALRHELAVLFVEQVTDGKAPPGLAAGVGAYAEDPNFSIGSRKASGTNPDKPTASWRVLWELTEISQDRGSTIQALSIVAYLVDVYGWPSFQQFLSSLPTEESYRQALKTAYGVELSNLEEQWELYYPYFFNGRWRANVFYDFDLSTFEQLLDAGAYSDAAEGLKGAIAFLEGLGDTAKIEQARALLKEAQSGQEAGALVQQSRQALQAQEFEHSIALAGQAETKYLEIGDQRRLSELSTYRSWAQEVLDLRREAQQVREQPGSRSAEEVRQRLMQIGVRLMVLGDEQGRIAVEQALSEIKARQTTRVLMIVTGTMLTCLALLIVRVLLLRRDPPPEAQLL